MAWKTYLIDCIIFLSMGGIFTLINVRLQYVYQQVSEIHNFTSNSSTDYCSTDTSEDEQTVADDATRIIIYMELAMGIPGILSSVILGSWSDKVGRKLPIGITLLGYCSCGVILTFILAFKWSPYSIILYGLAAGISGTQLLVGLSLAHISDVVKPSEKNMRYILLECSMSLGGGLVSFGTGYWIKSSGFFPATSFSTALILASLLLVPFLPEEKHGKKNEAESNLKNNLEKNVSKTSCLSGLRSILRLYTSEYSMCDICISDGSSMICVHGGGVRKGRIWRLWFYVVSFFLYGFVEMGLGAVQRIYFISYPLCFSPALLGASVGFRSVILAISPILIKLNQKYIHIDTQTIISVSIFLQIIVMILLAIARHAYIVFIGIAVGLLGNVTLPLIRSQVSSLVSTSEQGAVLSFLSSVETGANMVGSIAYLLLYPATLPIYHGFAFLICVVILTPAFVFMIVLWGIDKYTGVRFANEEMLLIHS